MGRSLGDGCKYNSNVANNVFCCFVGGACGYEETVVYFWVAVVLWHGSSSGSGSGAENGGGSAAATNNIMVLVLPLEMVMATC